jgi:hypothetical protein
MRVEGEWAGTPTPNSHTNFFSSRSLPLALVGRGRRRRPSLGSFVWGGGELGWGHPRAAPGSGAREATETFLVFPTSILFIVLATCLLQHVLIFVMFVV